MIHTKLDSNPSSFQGLIPLLLCCCLGDCGNSRDQGSMAPQRVLLPCHWFPLFTRKVQNFEFQINKPLQITDNKDDMQ